MYGVITRALLAVLLTVATAAGYQWVSRYDGPGHSADEAVGIGLYHGDFGDTLLY